MKKFLALLKSSLAVVDRAGEARQPVVEGDQEPEAGDRVAEHVLADVDDEKRPGQRDGPHHQGRESGSGSADGSRPNAFGIDLEAGHRERGTGGRQDRRLGRRRGRGQHRDDQELVERRAEHIGRRGR